jgi:hypothetical protein
MSGTRRARFYIYPDGTILPIIQGGGGTTLTQSIFRGYVDDAAMGSATPKANANTNWTQNVDENFRVRFGVLCEGMIGSITAQLQYDLNNSGTWNNVNATSSVVRSSASPVVNDNASTGQLITGGGFVGGRYDESDGFTDVATTFTTIPESTEFEFCVQIRSADVADGNTVQLRVINVATALNVYSASPSITVNVPASALDQVAYRGYDDDAGLGSATPKAAQNVGWTQGVNENFRVRFEVQETAGFAEAIGFQLQYNRNGAGWNNVTAASTVVRSSAGVPTDGAATADLLTAGAGTFVAGTFDEVDGAVASISIGASGHTEVEFCAQIRSADTVAGDTIQLRVIRAGGTLDAWTATPSLSIPLPSFSWETAAILPANNTHLPPILVGSTYYACAVNSGDTRQFAVFKTTTPTTQSSWAIQDSDLVGSLGVIGSMSWLLVGTTIHIVAKEETEAVRYWTYDTTTDVLSTREEISDAPQHATGMSAVDIAWHESDAHAVYSADFGGGSGNVVEYRNRDTVVGGVWGGTEEFVSDVDDAAMAGRLIVVGTTLYALWHDTTNLSGVGYASKTTGAWSTPTSFAALNLDTYFHELTNAVSFDAGEGAIPTVAYLRSAGGIGLVNTSVTETITTTTPRVNSETIAATLLVDGSGVPHILWIATDGSIKHQSRAGGTWGSVTEIQPAATSADLVHAAWLNGKVAYIYDDGTGGLVYAEYSVAAGGTAAGSYAYLGTAAGEITVQGSAVGSYVYSGAAAGDVTVQGTATGSYAYSGNATAAAPVIQGTAASSYAYSGSAAGEVTVQGSASGSYVYSGAATGEVTVQGTATGSYVISGAATGLITIFGSATGSYSYAGTITGAHTATERQFLRNIQTEPGTGGDVYDLDDVQGTGATLGSGDVTSTSFVEVLRFQRTVDTTVVGSSFPCSLDMASVTGPMEWRWRVQRINSSGAVQASSDYSPVFEDSGIKTATLALATTWQIGDRLAISVELRKSSVYEGLYGGEY